MARTLPKQDDTGHFNDRVPQELRQRMLSAANAIKDDFIGEQRESYGSQDISAIYGYHISGFIPFQLGGYEISELYRSDVDSSYHFTKAQTDAMNKAQESCYASFAWDYKDELLASGITGEKLGDPDYGDIEKSGLENLFADYENDWFEPALLRCEIWVDDPNKEVWEIGNDDVKPESVFIRLGLNYMDQPYYRSASDETLFQFNIPVADFMALDNDTLVKMLNEKLATVE